MKKILAVAISFLIVSMQSFASASITSNPDPMIAIGYGVRITQSEFMKLTPKEYKKLTGERLGIKGTIALKVIQKKLSKQPYWSGGKSQLVAAILAFAIGILGIHRFYLGYTWQGIVQILTLGGLGIWALIDFIRILTGDLQPKDGEYETPL